MDPYRSDTFPSWSEEDLWLRLDEALLVAISDPHQAFSIAWNVIADSSPYPDVIKAASEMIAAIWDVEVEIIKRD